MQVVVFKGVMVLFPCNGTKVPVVPEGAPEPWFHDFQVVLLQMERTGNRAGPITAFSPTTDKPRSEPAGTWPTTAPGTEAETQTAPRAPGRVAHQ